MMRIMLFLFTNFSVMILLGSIISVLGCCSINSNIQLMGIAGIFGLGGAFISLLLSKSIALSTVRGVVIQQASSDMERWLLQMICNYSTKLEVAPPQLAIYISKDMNAFATGARRNSALIAVSSSLLENMNRESIEAVIAHEMHHVVSGDMITMTLIQGVVNTFVIFVSRHLANLIYYWTSLINDERNERCIDDDYHNSAISSSLVYVILSAILELFFGGIASIIVFWFSRHREFYADAGAAKLVGRDKMIAALQELKYNCGLKAVNGSIATLCISNSIHNKKNTSLLLCDLFSSHPSLDKRIQALQSGLYFNSSYFF